MQPEKLSDLDVSVWAFFLEWVDETVFQKHSKKRMLSDYTVRVIRYAGISPPAGARTSRSLLPFPSVISPGIYYSMSPTQVMNVRSISAGCAGPAGSSESKHQPIFGDLGLQWHLC